MEAAYKNISNCVSAARKEVETCERNEERSGYDVSEKDIQALVIFLCKKVK